MFICTPVLFVARCPTTRWRHRGRWQLRRRRRLHRTGRRVPAFSQQPGWRAWRAQLRDLKMTAVLQLLLPVQHGLALHIERLRLLQQFHRALPLPCGTWRGNQTAVSDTRVKTVNSPLPVNGHQDKPDTRSTGLSHVHRHEPLSNEILVLA